MKALNIKNFSKAVMDIYSDYFEIKYGTDMDDRYIIGVDAKFHYKISIDKEAKDNESYQVWIWDIEKNMSYPMGVWPHDLSSSENFGKYLDNILYIADRGDFDGEKGCRITLK
jgi:hypothetical protein